MTSKKHIKVLSFGEILFDIIGKEEHLGGAPLNFAAHLAHLDTEVAMLSSVGCDHHGKKALDIISKLKISDSYIRKNDIYPTGIVEVKLTESGQPSYNICRDVAYDYISYSDEEIQRIISTDWNAFYFGTLAQRNVVSQKTLIKFLSKFNGEVFFDVNLRQDYYSKQMLEESFNFATIIKLNDDELRTISDILYKGKKDQKEFCSAICEMYDIKMVILTLGEKGCGLYYENNFITLPAVKAVIVDTVGAGDAFSAGFLYKYLTGSAPFEAIKFANSLAARIVSQRGAIPSDYFV